MDPMELSNPGEYDGTEEEWEPFVLTNPPVDGDVKLVGNPDWSKKRKVSQVMTTKSRDSAEEEPMPFQSKLLRDLLREWGDNVSELSTITLEADGNCNPLQLGKALGAL